MPDTERRKPEASSSSDFLHCGRKSCWSALHAAPTPSLKPQSLLHYRLRSYSSRSRSRITQNSIFPPDHCRYRRRTDRRKSAEPFKLHSAASMISCGQPASTTSSALRLQVNFAKTATHAILRRTARPDRAATAFQQRDAKSLANRILNSTLVVHNEIYDKQDSKALKLCQNLLDCQRAVQ